MLKNILMALNLIILEWRIFKILKKDINGLDSSLFSFKSSDKSWKNYLIYNNPTTGTQYDWSLYAADQKPGHAILDPNIMTFCQDLNISSGQWWNLAKELNSILNQHMKIEHRL